MPSRLPSSCLVAFAALAGGCLIPPGDTFFENEPPHIVDAEPSNGTVTVADGKGCTELSFKAVVADPDLDDLIRWRWFVDEAPVAENVIFNLEQRAERQTFAGWASVPKDTESPLRAVGAHTVELVVADTDIVGRSAAPRGRSIDGGVVPGGVDRLRWTVVQQQAADCPTHIQ